MSTASELAKLQHREFVARTKLWGIRTGDAHIVSADFVKDPDVQGALRRADVVLCNNYAFDPALNARLVDMFLDLKDGCKVVSLKSFVPAGHAISEHNRESPLNILEVEHLTFPTSSVSWTIAGGDFYVSTVNRSRLSKAVSA
jgi:H3 lysine-79-specific histone-lysine N-methyltransferase